MYSRSQSAHQRFIQKEETAALKIIEPLRTLNNFKDKEKCRRTLFGGIFLVSHTSCVGQVTAEN
jgi:hypothetical protein